MKLLYSNIGHLRILGFLEGVSFLLLMGVGMPLKYIWGHQHATYDLGMAHGVLFILYLIAVTVVKIEFKWSFKITFLAMIASVLPFGTFVADHMLFKKYSQVAK